MGLPAAQGALQSAGVAGHDLDLVIVATATPDQVFPPRPRSSNALGAIHAGAFDLSAGCSGFVYALSMAATAIRPSGAYGALIGAERSPALPTGPIAAPAFSLAMARAPCCLARGKVRRASLALRSAPMAQAQRRWPCDQRPAMTQLRGPCIVMDGRHVYRFASRVIVSALKRVVADAGVSLSDVDWIVPHQANQRIIDSACESTRPAGRR